MIAKTVFFVQLTWFKTGINYFNILNEDIGALLTCVMFTGQAQKYIHTPSCIRKNT